MEVRERIEKILAERDLSVRGTSIAAGLGETTLRNFLKGMTDSMTTKNMEKLAQHLGVPLPYLLYGVTTDVVDIWDRIPLAQQPQALAVLETFTKARGS